MPRRPSDPGVPMSPVEYFGAELRAYREAAGLARPQLAARLGYTPQWIGQVESGKSCPSENFAKDCDTHFETNGTFFRLWEWIQLVDRLRILPPGFPDFMEREIVARVIHIFETMVITGLFQTPEYACEVLKGGRSTEVTEKLVATRMKRQEVLEGDDPPHVVALFDEGAIRRPVGGPEVMRGQIRWLIGLTERPNVTIQIVPLGKGAYAGLPGAFMILGSSCDPDVVHVGGHVEVQLIDHPDVVRAYGVRFDLIRGAAMSADDSLDLLRAILEGL